MSTKGFLGVKKRAANARPADRGYSKKKRFKRPKPPAPPKATFVSTRKENDEEEIFEFEKQEVKNMLDFMTTNDPSFLR